MSGVVVDKVDFLPNLKYYTFFEKWGNNAWLEQWEESGGMGGFFCNRRPGSEKNAQIAGEVNEFQCKAMLYWHVVIGSVIENSLLA